MNKDIVTLPKEGLKTRPYIIGMEKKTHNIDNLESTLSGSGTSHHVNSILVTTKATEINREMEDDDEYQCPAKRKCHRSLPPEAISSEIRDYYGGKNKTI